MEDKKIFMYWIKTPSFLAKYVEVGDDALIAMSKHIPLPIYEELRNFRRGVVFDNGLKISLYKVEVVRYLIGRGFQVDLDGVVYDGNLLNIAGSLDINKLLNLSINSKNRKINELAHRQKIETKLGLIAIKLLKLFKGGESFGLDVLPSDYKKIEIKIGSVLGFYFGDDELVISLASKKVEAIKLKKDQRALVENSYNAYLDMIDKKSLINIEDVASQWLRSAMESTYEERYRKDVSQAAKRALSILAASSIESDELEISKDNNAVEVVKNDDVMFNKNIVISATSIDDSFDSIDSAQESESKLLKDLDGFNSVEDFLNSLTD